MDREDDLIDSKYLPLTRTSPGQRMAFALFVTGLAAVVFFLLHTPDIVHQFIRGSAE